MKELSDYLVCNWGEIPSNKLLTRGGEDNLIEREDSRLTFLKMAETFGPGSNAESVMKLFGPYFGNKDLLFQDTSIGLCQDHYQPIQIINKFNYCTTSNAITFKPVGVLLFILISNKLIF